MKKFFISIFIILMLTIFNISVGASYYTCIIDDKNDKKIEKMLSLIDNQSFSQINSEEALSLISHFLYQSDFSPFEGKEFPYKNYNYGSSITVNDGKFSHDIGIAAGCFAYSKFVSFCFYGTNGKDVYPKEQTALAVKELILSQAQAGEHLRIENTHSMSFISADSEGFYFLDYAGDYNPVIELCYTSYENIINEAKSRGKMLFLYNQDEIENKSEAVSEREISREHSPAELKIYYEIDSFDHEKHEKNGGEITIFDDKIAVSYPLSELKIDTSEVKTIYKSTEEFSIKNIKAQAIYGNNEKFAVNLTENELSVEGFDSKIDGNCPITVSYGSKSAKFLVNIEQTLLLGDANLDGRISPADARLALRKAAGLEELSTRQQKAADMDADGKIKASDARKILLLSMVR